MQNYQKSRNVIILHLLDLEFLHCMCHQQDMADETDISPYSKSVRL